jgi:hypothetical protein
MFVLLGNEENLFYTAIYSAGRKSSTHGVLVCLNGKFLFVHTLFCSLCSCLLMLHKQPSFVKSESNICFHFSL